MQGLRWLVGEAPGLAEQRRLLLSSLSGGPRSPGHVSHTVSIVQNTRRPARLAASPR